MKKVNFLYLSQEDVVNVGLDIQEVISVVEDVFEEHGKKRVELPPKPGVHPSNKSFIHAMPAYIPSMKISGIKWVSGFPENNKYGLPQIMGILVLNDVDTGRPLAIMDCRWITAIRTAAVTAVTAKYCARKNSEVIGLIGAGVQGRFNVVALKQVIPNIKEVKVYDINEDKVIDYSKFISKKTDLVVSPALSIKDAVVDSDIVITATQRVEKPIINYAWLKEGVFAVGLESGKAWGKIVVKANKFVTDDWEQTKYFASQGSFPGGLPEKYTEIGEMIINKKPGRESNIENIIACNVGLAISDIALGYRIYKEAVANSIGIYLPLMELDALFV